MSLLVVIMGVSGAGKTTVAKALAQQTGWPMIEGDDHHRPENITKQVAGIPLENADRAGWIDAMAAAANALPMETPVILACSALNAFVRERLSEAADRPCKWVLLDVPRAVLQARLEARPNHFMPASLLGAQLEALQPPADPLRIDGTQSAPQICDVILRACQPAT